MRKRVYIYLCVSSPSTRAPSTRSAKPQTYAPNASTSSFFCFLITRRPSFPTRIRIRRRHSIFLPSISRRSPRFSSQRSFAQHRHHRRNVFRVHGRVLHRFAIAIARSQFLRTVFRVSSRRFLSRVSRRFHGKRQRRTDHERHRAFCANDVERRRRRRRPFVDRRSSSIGVRGRRRG